MLSQIIKGTQTQTVKAIAIVAAAVVLAIGIVVAPQVVAAAGSSAGGGLQVLTPIVMSATNPGPGWHLDPAFDNHPVVELFVNQPVHNATYTDRNAIPLQYRVEFGVCANEPSHARVLARYDANGGLQTTFTGDANVNWVLVHDALFQGGNNCGGPHFCLASNNFSATFALTNLAPTATHTTVQIVAKWNNDTINDPAQPDSNLQLSDRLIHLGLAHAFNIFVNVPAIATPTPTPTPTPTATPTPTPAPQVVKCQDGETVTMQNGNIVICNNNVNNNSNSNSNSATGGNASIGDIKINNGNQTVKVTVAKAAAKPAAPVILAVAPAPVQRIISVPVTAKTGAEAAIPALLSTLMGGAGMVVGIRKWIK